jgi:outer membrane protein
MPAMEFIKLSIWSIVGLMGMSTAAFAQTFPLPKSRDAQIKHDASSTKKTSVTVIDEKRLSEADALIKNGNPETAYELLLALEYDYAGEVRFDYLLGIAALDSGRPDKATLAFERVLAVDKNLAAARLELARAYFQLGDLLRAQTEFETILQLDPPESTRVNIRKYLDAIAEPASLKQTRITAYVEGVVGRDSNINSATEQPRVRVPSLGIVFTLNPKDQKKSDYFYGWAVGSNVLHQLNANWMLYAGGDLSHRAYETQTLLSANNTQATFNSIGLSGRTGVQFSDKANHYRVGVLGGTYSLSNALNRDVGGLNSEWTYSVSQRSQVNVFAQYVRYRFYQAALQPNDFNQQAVGAGAQHVFNDGKSLLYVTGNFGSEVDVSQIISTNTPNGGRIDGAKYFNGLRAGAQLGYKKNVELFASAGWQAGYYQKINLFFLRYRTDNLFDLTLGANWHLDKLWTLRPQMVVTNNRSNIEIYSYARTDLSITLRREFK